MKKKPKTNDIKKILKWFHGEEFEKYPFIEDEEYEPPYKKAI